MSTVAKILVVVNLILAGAFLASASNFLGRQENWKTRHDQQQVDLEAKIKDWMGKHQGQVEEFSRLEMQTRSVQEANAGLKSDNTQFRSQNDLLNQSFKESSSQLTMATAALEKAQATIQAQREMVDGLQSERNTNLDAVRAALGAKEAAVRNLNEKAIQFETLLAEKQALESRIEDLNQEVNSLRLTAQNALARLGGTADVPLDQPAHLGQIVAVAPEGNIAIISLGAEDGVKPGFRYTVSRGNNFVGVLEITDVEAKKAAGRSIGVLQRSRIQTGDRVMTAR